MTYEPDDTAHVRLPLISLVLLVALPAALIPVLQFLSISLAGNGAIAPGGAAVSLSLEAQPGSIIAGSIIGLLVAYVIGGRKAMFLAVLSIVVAVAAMLAIGSPLAFSWGRTALNLAAGALLVLPILVLGHYGSHRQIAAGMPGLILGPFLMVALIGLLTRPETEDRIAALTDLGGLDVIEPMGWLAIVLTVLLVLSLFRAMGRARGGRPNALFSAELRADARDALGFVLTGPQIYALLIAMALAGHAATIYLGDFARKSSLEGFGVESTIVATICLGLGGFVIARIFGPRRRQHVLGTTIVFIFITTGLMAATDIMFAPTAGTLGVFVWPYTQGQLVLLVLTCAAMAMLGASFAMIWLAIVEVGIGVLATILLITVLVARIGAPAAMPLLPIPEMWLATVLLGAALVLVTLGTMFGRRRHNVPTPAPSADFAALDPAELADYDKHEEPGFDAATAFDDEPIEVTPEASQSRAPRPPVHEPVTHDTPEEPPAPVHEPLMSETPDAPPPSLHEPVVHDAREEPPARSAGRLPWRRKRGTRDTPAEPLTQETTPAAERPEPPRPAPEKRTTPTPQEPSARHEAVQETRIDWEKLGATVVNDESASNGAPATPTASEDENAPRPAPDRVLPVEDRVPSAEKKAEEKEKPPANRPKSANRPESDGPVFTRNDSTIFDFDRLRTNTRKPDMSSDQTDEDKE